MVHKWGPVVCRSFIIGKIYPKGGDTVYAVVHLRNGVGSFTTVFRADSLATKVKKYFSAGWTVYVGKTLFNDYSVAKAVAARL